MSAWYMAATVHILEVHLLCSRDAILATDSFTYGILTVDNLDALSRLPVATVIDFLTLDERQSLEALKELIREHERIVDELLVSMETKPVEQAVFSEGLSAYVHQDWDRWRECRDSSFFARATRMVKHPSRSRQLRRIQETKSPRMAILLKVVFNFFRDDSYATCLRCQWTRSRKDKFFGRRTDGRWRNVCRTCDAEAVRSWQKRNPNKVKDQQARRRQRITDASGKGVSHWKKEIIRRSCGGRCAYCDEAVSEGKEEWDHMTPICDGGANTPSNITLSCSSCNRRKGGRPAEDYIAYRKKYGQPTRSWPPGNAPWEIRSFMAFGLLRRSHKVDRANGD